MANKTTNVVLAGVGGQGVLKASDILSEAAFRFGLDVKKAEIHGMSQRGGSVNSDVRFGEKVLSPMIPDGQCDFLVVLAEDEVSVNTHRLGDSGVLLSAGMIDPATLPNPRSLNVAMLGLLSTHLDIPENIWRETIKEAFPQKHEQDNRQAFSLGRQASLP